MTEEKIVRSIPGDVDDFFDLFLMSGPEFVPALYGDVYERVARGLFLQKGNLTSYEHVHIARVDGRNAGMVCTYDWKQNKQEQTRTMLLLIKHMKLKFFKQGKALQWAGEVLGRMDAGTYYIASMAVYPEFRSHGLGTGLLKHAEELARSVGAHILALDAETYNETAIRLYKAFGMNTEGEPKSTEIGGQRFEFARMVKKL